MFTSNIFDSSLNLATSAGCTLVVGFIFFRMFTSYNDKRHNKVYSLGRTKAPSIAAFNIISKFMFMSSMLITLISYWFRPELFFSYHQSTLIQALGAGLVLVGFIKLNQSFADLGNNYSPSFDAYLPTSLITSKSYSLIRHPIYLYNLFISFGLGISSGSVLVAINAMIGLLFLLRIIHMEEAYLVKHFPGYLKYSEKSWRLIPYCY